MRVKPLKLTLLYIISTYLLLNLAWWQYSKYKLKTAVLENFKSKVTTTLPVDNLNWENVARLSLKTVHCSGKLLAEHTIFLANQYHNKTAGHLILVPMLLESDKVILLNLGWSSISPNKLYKQVLQLPKLQQVQGVLKNPSFGLKLWSLKKIDAHPVSLDFKALAVKINKKVYPLVLNPTPNLIPLPQKFSPTFPLTPQRHLAYAIQWLALAVGFLWYAGILLYKSWLKANNAKNSK